MANTTRISVPDGKVGDIVWTAGIRVNVQEREEFYEYPGLVRMVVQLRGPVLNVPDLDEGTLRFVRMSSEGRDDLWWTIQGNELAHIEKEESD